jgi:hypothetical protein
VSYKVQLTDRVRRQIASWNLPDAVLVEVYLRLRERLAENPTDQLIRTPDPFDGLVYAFEMVDPQNRLSVYRLFFHVIYGQDEETLYVLNGAMLYSFGL